MYLMDAIDSARGLNLTAKDMREQLIEKIEQMEFADTAEKCTVLMWVKHYIDGVCSSSTFFNVMKQMNLDYLFAREEGEITINEDGSFIVKSEN